VCVCVCVSTTCSIYYASRMRREKMGDNWRSNSAQFGAIFRPSHYFVIQRKTRTRIKREREEQREDNTRRRRRRRRGRRRRSTETHGPGGDAGRASRRPRVRLPVREHRFVSRRGRALFFSSQKRRCATSFTFFVLVVSSFEFAQKRALFTKDDDDDDASLSLSLSLSLLVVFCWWTRRYSYAQKKYNPNGTKPKKIGAKKKKMLALKSGMRRPE
jgi:hypothetical protein